MQTVFFGNFLMQLSAAPTGQRQRETKLKAKEECIYFFIVGFCWHKSTADSRKTVQTTTENLKKVSK